MSDNKSTSYISDILLLIMRLRSSFQGLHYPISAVPISTTCLVRKESESEVAQSCPTLCDPVDCSPSGSSVHGILQARILEWVAIPFSRGSSWPRDRIQVSWIAGRFFTYIWPAGKPSPIFNHPLKIVRLVSSFKSIVVCINVREQNIIILWCLYKLLLKKN